jgi:MraZ protein
MNMFLGTFTHTLDNKNRLSLPSKFIALLPQTIVVNKGFDGCLEIRSADDFKVYANKIIDYPHTKRGTRDVSREIIANAADLEVDSAKRILIPTNLLTEAKIQKNIVILGVGNRIEL